MRFPFSLTRKMTTYLMKKKLSGERKFPLVLMLEPLHGPMTAGNTMHLGPCACIEVHGIRVLLSSAKAQMLDLDLYRFLGVEPAQMKLLVNKSSVHFRAAFQPIASHILVAKAPGPMAADPSDLPWTKLPAGMSTKP